MAIDIYKPSTLDKFSREEAKLYQRINQHRADNGLPPIPPSQSLSLVANRHTLDLQENIGEITHGWSDAEYDNSDPDTWPAMWEAPQRFNTGYDDNGFENAFFSSAGADAKGAFNSWKNSSGHNAVILNQGIWEDNPWNALGISIYGDYAVMWVGESSDPNRAPKGVKKGIRSGSSGNNTVKGSKHDEVLTGLEGNDKVLGRGGDDILGGGAGQDRLRGQAGNDYLFGQDGDDLLQGGGGNDVFYGGGGNDRLSGNAGDDVFAIELGNGIDTVTDFGRGGDRLGLTGSTTFSDLSFEQVGANTIVSLEGTQVMTLQNVSQINPSQVVAL